MPSQNRLNLAIQINGKEVKGTLSEINRDFFKLRNSVNKLEEGTDEWVEANKELAKVEKERERQIKVQREFREEIKKTIEAQEDSTEVLGRFGENMSLAFLSLKNGDMVAFQSAWKGIAENIRYAGKAALAFIATPFGAMLAALAGIVAITREWAAYNKEALEANITTQQITNLTEQSLDNARIRAKAIEETFGNDFKSNLEVAKKLVEGFGVSYDEAFDVIEDGLIRGGKENDEFLKSLNEYPKLFAQAGFTIKEFQKIVNAGIDLGVYDDKLPDAIKEFSLSVQEQTQSSKDALINAFGEDFTNDLFSNINKGNITVKESLSIIAQEAKNVGLNSKQAAVLTADLFRGAGEDAGGALLIFEAINDALNQEQRELTALEEITRQASEANKELGKAKDDALKSDGFATLSSNASLFWTKIKTEFYKGVEFIANQLERANQFAVRNIGQISAVILNIPSILKTSFIEVKDEVFDVIKSLGGLGDVISKVLKFDFEGAKESAADFRKNFKKEISDVKNTAQDTFSKIKEVYDNTGKYIDQNFEKRRQGAVELAKLQNETQENEFTLNPNAEDKSVDEEAQKRIDKEKQVRQRVYEALKQFEQEREIQEQLNKFEKEKRAEEEEIIRLELKFQKLIEDAAGETELLTSLEEEKLLQIQAIRDKYNEIYADKDKTAKEKLAKQNEAFNQRIIEIENKLLDAKNRAYIVGISSIKSFFNNASGIYLALLALEKGLAVNEIVVNSSKAIAQIKANYSIAASKALAIHPISGAGIALALNSLAAKEILTTKITAATQIASIAAATLKGFADGGFTDRYGLGYRDGSGQEVAGVVHTGEYVVPKIVRNDPEVPPILEYLESKRKQKLGLNSTSPQSTSTANKENDVDNNGMLTTSINKLLQKLDEPFITNLYWGFEAEEKRQKVQQELDKLSSSKKIG